MAEGSSSNNGGELWPEDTVIGVKLRDQQRRISAKNHGKLGVESVRTLYE
jgi:hypothetical protein